MDNDLRGSNKETQDGVSELEANAAQLIEQVNQAAAKKDDAADSGVSDLQSTIYDSVDLDPRPATYESDWQTNSILLFAHQTCEFLRHQPIDQPEKEILCTLIQEFMKAVQAYYTRGIDLLRAPDERPRPTFTGAGHLQPEPNPAEHRQMVERIGDEWTRLMSLISVAQLLAHQERKADPAIDKLYAAIALAEQDLNLTKVWNGYKAGRNFAVLPHFGRHFELIKFRYAPDIFVIGVPVTSLYSPWDLTFIWHEIAGIYIERGRGRDGQPAPIVEQTFQALRKQVDDDQVWEQWLPSYGGEMEPLLQSGNPSLVANGRPTDDVLRNWAEELVEDAVGVLCLGDSMAAVLEGILARRYATSSRPSTSLSGEERAEDERQRAAAEAVVVDEQQRAAAEAVMVDKRHPPRGLRIAVAQSLAEQMMGRAATNVGPSGEVLAAVIWKHHRWLVKRIFKETAERGTSNTLNSDDQLRLDIAHAASNFRRDQGRGEQIREAVYGHHYSPPPLAPSDHLFADIDSWEGLQEFLLSEVDLGDAVAVDAGDSWSPWGSYITVRVSGVSAHSQSHSGNCRLYHSWHG